jgi:hypothetical protein
MKRLVLFAVAWLVLNPAALRAEGPDDQFIRVYNLIQQADALREAGQTRAAQERYLEAQAALQKLQADYPQWNERIINYRKGYITEKLGPEGAAAAAALGAAKTPPSAPKPAPDEREQQIGALTQEIAQLRAESQTLQAKLREALSAQPAAVDPR